MMPKQPDKSRVFFRRFFAVNLVISIVPLMLLSALAQSVFQLYRTSAVEEERQRVQRVISQIDGTLNNAINTCRHYALNSDALEEILYYDKDKSLHSAEYVDLLRSAYTTLTTSFTYPEEASMKDFRIIQPANQNEVMLSSTNASSGLETLYYAFQNQPLSYSAWNAFVFGKGEYPALLMDSNRQLCVFFYQPDKRCSAPYDSFALMLCFQPALLLGSEPQSSGALILADAANRPLFRQSASVQECYALDEACLQLQDGYIGALDGVKSCVVGCASELYGYRLYSVHAYAQLLAQPLRAERVFYCVLLAVLAACIGLSYYSARRHSEPLVPFIALAAPLKKANYQDTLSSIYSSVVLQQERTQAMLSQHSTMTRRMLLERLFEAPYVENAQMEQILSMCKVDLSAPAFAVLVLRIVRSARDSLAGYAYDLCVNLFASRGYIYLSRANDVAILFHGDCFSPEARQGLAEEMDRSLCGLLQASYQICVGPAVDSKGGIFQSYACACETLNRAQEDSARILCSDDASQQAFTYTSEMQSALSRQLKAGKSAGVFRLLDNIWAARSRPIFRPPMPHRTPRWSPPRRLWASPRRRSAAPAGNCSIPASSSCWRFSACRPPQNTSSREKAPLSPSEKRWAICPTPPSAAPLSGCTAFRPANTAGSLPRERMLFPEHRHTIRRLSVRIGIVYCFALIPFL